MQASEEQATRSGIEALSMAFKSIQLSQSEVKNAKGELSNSYGGVDGGAYQRLLEQWDGQVDTILFNLDRMVDELNNTLSQHGLAQGSASDAVNQQYARSTEAFDASNPGGPVTASSNPITDALLAAPAPDISSPAPKA